MHPSLWASLKKPVTDRDLNLWKKKKIKKKRSDQQVNRNYKQRIIYKKWNTLRSGSSAGDARGKINPKHSCFFHLWFLLASTLLINKSYSPGCADSWSRINCSRGDRRGSATCLKWQLPWEFERSSPERVNIFVSRVLKCSLHQIGQTEDRCTCICPIWEWALKPAVRKCLH